MPLSLQMPAPGHRGGGDLWVWGSLLKDLSLGNSLAVQYLGLGAFTVRAQIRSLVRELRSHKMHGAA